MLNRAAEMHSEIWLAQLEQLAPTVARSWERAAFIRARPVAGNLALGEQFLASISAFIWRRNFDYTVIDDLQVWLRHLPAPKGYQKIYVSIDPS